MLGREDAVARRHAVAACLAFAGVFAATFFALTALRWAFPRWPLEPTVVGYPPTDALTAVFALVGVASLAVAVRAARAGSGLAVSLLAALAPASAYYAGWMVATFALDNFTLYAAGALVVGVVGFAAGHLWRLLAGT